MNLPLTGQSYRQYQLSKKKQIYFSDNRYVVKLAETMDEIDEVLKLRFAVFNLELNEGFDSSYSTLRDEDQFDSQCNHLLVIEKTSGNIAGTYRLQTFEMARKGDGFYSETEFDISSVGRSMLRRSVELGRACISKTHRNGRVLMLLWKGIWQYLNIHEKRFLFGCCSMDSQDTLDGIRLFRYLEMDGLVHPHFRIMPKPGFTCLYVQPRHLTSPLSKPPLMMDLYFRYNALVCSYPAIDREFKTIDFLVMLDVHNLNEESRKLLK
jgi:putative hemolysin